MMLRHTLATLALATTLPLAAHAEAIPATRVLTTSLSVDAAAQKLTETLTSKGMTVFAVMDHQAAAQKAGLTMQAAKVIVYGAPKAGTPLMEKDPHFALKLPLKVLLTQNRQGQTEVVFDNAARVIQDSKIDYADVENTLGKAEQLIENTFK